MAKFSAAIAEMWGWDLEGSRSIRKWDAGDISRARRSQLMGII